MTLIWIPQIELYIGWQQCMRSRKLHLSCTKASINAWVGPFELFWDWSQRQSTRPWVHPVSDHDLK